MVIFAASLASNPSVSKSSGLSWWSSTPRGGSLSERFKLYVGESTVWPHALPEEAKHVVADCFDRLAGFHRASTPYICKEAADVLKPPLCFCWRQVHWELAAAEVIAQRSGRVQDKAASGYQTPTIFQAALLTNKLEVVDVDAENQFELPAVEQALPAGQ